MDARTAWPAIGLGFGTALGFAGAFGGFGTFVIVLVLGVLGLLVGLAATGDLDLVELFSSFRARKGPS
ncbi:hypothetical protein [Actinomadura rugatobispora]|uniref:DUF2273 domain-containing protein n=1 Tax=Actinomadura rugatobispora TaxID=1994 RepID=A0ABW0ZR08_9ACTN|nr:hypothetical protein GCM10010200_028760 [Actinomadura rugatobispora]